MNKQLAKVYTVRTAFLVFIEDRLEVFLFTVGFRLDELFVFATVVAIWVGAVVFLFEFTTVILIFDVFVKTHEFGAVAGGARLSEEHDRYQNQHQNHTEE